MEKTTHEFGDHKLEINHAPGGTLLTIRLESKNPPKLPQPAYVPNELPSKSSVMEVCRYIRDVLRNRESFDSRWPDERGEEHSADVGYGIQFTEILMEELERVAIPTDHGVDVVTVEDVERLRSVFVGLRKRGKVESEEQLDMIFARLLGRKRTAYCLDVEDGSETPMNGAGGHTTTGVSIN